MFKTAKPWLRLMQIGVALIPCVIGILALVNDISAYKETLTSTIIPLITMQGDTAEAWRALPAPLAPVLYIGMFTCEFLVGVLALIGIIKMIRAFGKEAATFEQAKNLVYVACGFGIIIWGLGFFEGGGDWFLSWMNNNLAGFQQGGLNYALEMLIAFVYLKLNKDTA